MVHIEKEIFMFLCK